MNRLLAAFPITCAVVVMTIAVAQAQEPGSETNALRLTQAVRPTTAGQFQARVLLPMPGAAATEVPNAQVTLLGGEGTIHQGTTNIRGDVTIEGVAPGIYAMTTRAKGLFACYAMRVLGDDQASDRTFPETAEVSCALVTSQRFGATVLPYLASAAGRDHLGAGSATVVADVRRSGSPAYRIARSAGGLVGSLRTADGQVAKQMNVFIFKSRKNVGRAISDDQGRFTVSDLPSGIYSMVAVGSEGVAALGFELVDAVTSNAGVNSARHTFVNQAGSEDATLDVDVIPVSQQELEEVVGVDDADDFSEETVMEDQELVSLDEFGNPIVDGVPVDGFGDPMAGGGFASGGGGSFGGGGGGGGGFGGGGAIAGAALLGVAAAVAATSDDNNFRALPTSPVLPVN